MPTNPKGNNVTKSVSMEPELWEAATVRFGAGTPHRTFSAYVRALILADLKSAPYSLRTDQHSRIEDKNHTK